MRSPQYYNKVFEMIAEAKLPKNYDVNSGGCGWFARAIKKKLPELQIVYVADDQSDLERYQKRTPASCSHVVLSDGRMYYDARGVHAKRTFRPECTYRFEVDLPFLEKSLEVDHLWNWMFDRGNIKIVEKIVNQVIESNKE
jgi:hypothetical protein